MESLLEWAGSFFVLNFIIANLNFVIASICKNGEATHYKYITSLALVMTKNFFFINA